MAAEDLVARLSALLEPEAERHGLELVTVEQAGGRATPIIRVLLDREDGIGLDEIAQASRWVSALLDEADPIAGAYTLEVSSPGIDRPLVKLADYERFAGETATVKTREYGNRTSWTGAIVGVSGTTVVLDVEGEQVSIPFEHIAKARLKGVVDFSRKEGAGHR